MDKLRNDIDAWMSGVSLEDKIILEDMSKNESELQDAFYRDLAFGTGGLRGIVGLGPNRMNVYTVRKATQGLANYLNSRSNSPSVVIARDSRRMGEQFVQCAAEVLAASGIKVYIYPRIEPTPALSFAVRDLGCSAGVCITASHNPAPYNGYKVYGPDGCQITMHVAKEIQFFIDKVGTFDDVNRMEFSQAISEGAIEWVGEGTLDRFIDSVVSFGNRLHEDSPISVAYTPLHGTGLECVSRMFDGIGVDEVYIEPSQSEPNGEFPTCPYPNPEMREALELGLAIRQEKDADLLLATDPDADRVGVAVSVPGGYRLLTGNEVGILLIDYLLGKGLVANPVVVTTIVSSAMADIMAKRLGFNLRRTLTGFKYIGEQIALLEANGEESRFLFGFEESYGYLAGTQVRDKDAVMACMLVCQMARFHKSRGRNLSQVLDDLYREYGCFKNGLVSVDYLGADGSRRMGQIMSGLRASSPASVAGLAVEEVVDYSEGIAMPEVNGRDDEVSQMLPEANVLELRLTGGNKIIIRPSGTEPKVKVYVFAVGEDERESNELLALLSAAAEEMLE